MFPLWREALPSCPQNQNYYRCASVSYAGCCTHDPCGSGFCTAIPSDQAFDSCSVSYTVTVTQTMWQGAPNNAVDATDISTSSTFSTVTAGEPTTVTDSPSTTDLGTVLSSAIDAAPTISSSQSASSPLPRIPIATTHTTLTSTAPGTTKTLSLVSETPSHGATSSAQPKPDKSGSSKSSPHGGTIAGSVVGSLAGLALIVALLFWCLRRRKKSGSKFSFTRKVQKGQDPKEMEAIKKERDLALERMEENRNITAPSPRSFDFGLPPIPKTSTSPSTSPRTAPPPWL